MMVPEQPVCAWTAPSDFSVPLVTVIVEFEVTEPCTVNGTDLLRALTLRPSSAALVLRVRMALSGRFAGVTGTCTPATPVLGSGLHCTAALLAGEPGPPGTRFG